MRKLFIALLYVLVLADGTTGWAADDTLERLLRAQAFNREFEGFDSYYVMIEADHPQPDGSHEVLAVASGKFSENTKRMKVLFLIMDGHIVGGQVLEGTGLPPCLAPEHRSSSSL
ncbi:MAG: hypothetical protein GDA68_13110 [Nitrospira sp. CR2.1]|nr:hypothetical protein [Nitrospira sp. CR2.1]MBA5875327.1 hypothetical protein [Nitrospira sp. CR1.2]